MDFEWSAEQRALRDSVIEFARRELVDDSGVTARPADFPREAWRRCARFGIQGLAVPADYGGSGLDALSTILALEALGYACRDNGLIFGINAQMWAVQAPLLRFGTDAQRARYLPALVAGELIGAHAMSEPESGSDCFALSTRYTRVDGRFVLNGRKTFVSNAPVADLFLVFATVRKSRGFMGITAFLIDRNTPGLHVGETIRKMGLHSSPMAEIALEDCAVDPACVLGTEGNGGTIFNHAMGWERACILASVVGTMERQLEACVEYARARSQFGKPIGKYQAVSGKIVDIKLWLETSRLLLYRAGWLRARGEDATQEVALAKLHLSDCAVRAALNAVQVHGGYGYMADFGFEAELRDAVGARLYSGTSEIQREIVAHSLGL